MQCQVLLVEDDYTLRWMMAEDVAYLGHIVTLCANADKALLHLGHTDPVELVITDAHMPGHSDGLDLSCQRDRSFRSHCLRSRGA